MKRQRTEQEEKEIEQLGKWMEHCADLWIDAIGEEKLFKEIEEAMGVDGIRGNV